MAAPPSTVAGAEADADGRRERQVAQRVFAAEFNAASHQVKEEGTYGPSFVVSPFGAKVNRLFAVGVLTSVECCWSYQVGHHHDKKKLDLRGGPMRRWRSCRRGCFAMPG